MMRNRRKIEAALNNAQQLLEIREEFGSFDEYICGLVDGKPIDNCLRSIIDMPSKTERSETMSRDLKRGFKFVGPTICYSFLQAMRARVWYILLLM